MEQLAERISAGEIPDYDTVPLLLNGYVGNVFGALRPLLDSSGIQTQLPVRYFEGSYPKGLLEDWQRKWRSMDQGARSALIASAKLDVLFTAEIIAQNLYDQWQPFYYCGFNAIMSIAVPERGYVLPGQPVRARILTGGWERSGKLTVTANIPAANTSENGIATLRTIAPNTPGRQTLQGTVTSSYRDSVTTVPWSTEYYVGKSCAGLQLPKMAIVYRDVQNPVTVSALGYASSQIALIAPGATVVPAGEGKFSICPGRTCGPRLLAYLVVRHGNGKTDTLDVGEYRVKDLPLPDVRLQGWSGSDISREQLMDPGQIRLEERSEGLSRSWLITGFSLRIVRANEEEDITVSVSGSDFSLYEAPVAALRTLRSGDHVVFEHVRIAARGQQIRELPGLTLRIRD